MSNITIFTAPKPFSDPHINIIQRNAIQSWKYLGPGVEVFLIGDEAGMKEASVELNVRQLPDVTRNELGTPLVSSIFSLAREASSSDILIYLNADIMLLPECLDVIDLISEQYDEFLLVGQRWNLDIKSEIDFSGDWTGDLGLLMAEQDAPRSYKAMDYFIFPRKLFKDIPPFAIGRAGWDNWMIYHAIQKSWPVVDITPSHRVIHQNHDYGHLPNGVAHYHLEESYQNVSLGGGMRNTYDLLDVPYTYINGKIRRKKLSLARLLRKLERIVIPGDQKGWRWKLTLILRKTRWIFSEKRR